MIPREHQVEGANWALTTLREHYIAYLSWEERTGKTLTALLAIEQSKAASCLIVTKKKAIQGWVDTLNEWKHTTKFEVINYESIHKITSSFNSIILDEAHHAISGYPKPSITWKRVAKYTGGRSIIYLSATPYAETVGQLYHQFKLSNWSPWKAFKNYYDFHRHYGIPKTIYTPYGPQLDRSVFRVDEVLDTVKYLFSFKTRAEVGIKQEPKANMVIVPLKKETLGLIRQWKKDRVLPEFNLVGDSDSKLRMVHYQLEGSTLKLDDTRSLILPMKEKINYIKKHYKLEDIVIMAHFIKERELLNRELPSVKILSSDGHAEGIDLSMYKKLIVYSMSFKTSKFTQRLARQANHKRTLPIVVDILVCDKPAIGRYVYDMVALKKENFVKSSYLNALFL